MNHSSMSCCQSDVSAYLTEFQRILNTMICRMTCACLTDSISHNFIVQMIPHHRAAIEMSQNLLRFRPVPQLRDIACGIIEEQTKSISDMEAILSCCSCCVNSSEELRAYRLRMNQIQQTMFSRMRNARATSQIDCNFMWEMIPHHQGAVEMSALTLRSSICDPLTPILTAIYTSQTKGIAQMEALLRELHCGGQATGCGCDWTNQAQ